MPFSPNVKLKSGRFHRMKKALDLVRLALYQMTAQQTNTRGDYAKILILYENHSVGVSLLGVLAKEGYEVLGLDSVDMIWEQFKTTHPDLVLLDSDSDGFGAMKLYFDIRQKYADLPAIIYKAVGDDAMDRIKGAVADALVKPRLRGSGSTFRVEKADSSYQNLFLLS